MPKYKIDAMAKARQLFYGAKVVKMIENAKDEAEVQRILTGARRGEYK